MQSISITLILGGRCSAIKKHKQTSKAERESYNYGGTDQHGELPFLLLEPYWHNVL